MAEPSSPVTTMAAFRSRGRWLAAAMIAAWLLVVPAASAADGDTEGILDRPIVDVLLVERDGAPWPDLLTLDTSIPFGPGRLTLLRRDVTWSVVDETAVDLGQSFDLFPWLVDLGGRRYAVVSVLGQGASVVLPFRVDPSSPADQIRVGTTVSIESMLTGAGAADVMGDSAKELVLAGPQGDDPDSCAGDKIEVLSGEELQERHTAAVPAMNLAGAALGEWDGRPGADLLANAYESCSFPGSRHLLAMRLRDGSTIVDITAPQTESPAYVSNLPLVVDVDGDGRDEAVFRDETSISIIDPADGWRAMTIADGNVAPLVAMPWPGDRPSALVSWVGSLASEPTSLWVARIIRDGGSLRIDGLTGTPLGGARPDELAFILTRLRFPELQYPTMAWTGDLDGDGCPDVLAPLVRATCLGAGPVEPGPLWLDTRPLAVVGPAGERRLLTALGREWYPGAAALMAPAPAAAAPGTWRLGPSGSFTLVELPVPSGPNDPVAAVASPLVDPYASADGRIDLSGPIGSRLLVRAFGLPGLAQSREPISTRSYFLQMDMGPQEFIGLLRIPAPPGTGAGGPIGSVPFDLTAVWTPVIAPPFQWSVAAATLDAWGNMSDPVVVTAVHDLTAPRLEVGVPLLSAPWPFEGAVAGMSEPGTTVRLGDGPPLTVDAPGSFELRTQLAPWPQTIVITAVDPSGNATAASVSVMGGLDIRQLPWAAIGAVALLVAVLVSSVRGSRRAPSVAVLTVRPDDDHQLEIEELGESPVRRRG